MPEDQETTQPPCPAGLTPWQGLAAAALLLFIPVLLFWRDFPFYMIDDWTALLQMAGHPFGDYLLVPDGDQWFPFFHLIFYGLVRLAGERYQLLVLVNCLGTGVNAFLVFLFFRRHLGPGLALTLSALYAGAAVHHAIAWNSFYLSYLLSLGFFLGALLLTDAYLRNPGRGWLWGIGCCALLSVLSHNYSLAGLMALPLYALLVRGDSGRKFWALAGTVAAVYLVFTLGYLSFAGARAAASQNSQVFAGLPGPNYLVHLFFGAVLAPFFYLFWGHYHFPVFWGYWVTLTWPGSPCSPPAWPPSGAGGRRRSAAWPSGPCSPTPCPSCSFL